jgi:hypothetical protein
MDSSTLNLRLNLAEDQLSKASSVPDHRVTGPEPPHLPSRKLSLSYEDRTTVIGMGLETACSSSGRNITR